METADSLIELARIVKVIGLKGELKVLPFTRTPQDLDCYSTFFIAGNERDPVEYRVESIRANPRFAVIKFAEFEGIEDAEPFIGCELLVRRAQLRKIEESEYFIRDLIGIRVHTQKGEDLGTLTDVIELPSHDIYQVGSGESELLIPAVSDYILDIDVEHGRMIVRLPEGLRDLA